MMATAAVLTMVVMMVTMVCGGEFGDDVRNDGVDRSCKLGGVGH